MNEQRRRLFGSALRLACGAGLLAMATAKTPLAMAQETVVIGGSGQSAVEVNLGILRDLDGGSNQRALRFPGEPADQSIVLRPPGGAAGTTASTERRPALRPPAPSLAARPVAPVVRAPVAPPPAPAPAAAPPRKTEPAPATAVPPPLPPPPAVVRDTSRDSAAPQRVPPQPAARPENAVPPPPPARQQTAALPPPAEGQALQLVFEPSSTQLNGAAETQLRQLAGSLATSEQRIQLKAFASGTSERPSAARRESLSRALAVRSFLIENGIRSTRIDVRALGQPTDGGPNDRVDVILLTQ
jgi:outer membrane protein OmpA-like peptidoglycan-associated protein